MSEYPTLELAQRLLAKIGNDPASVTVTEVTERYGGYAVGGTRGDLHVWMSPGMGWRDYYTAEARNTQGQAFPRSKLTQKGSNSELGCLYRELQERYIAQRHQELTDSAAEPEGFGF